MRISDWSSDVCSSDLDTLLVDLLHEQREGHQLHPKNAEAGGFGRRVECCRDAEPERHAGIERIDDAVVPQPGRRIIGMALLLILGADRSLESLLVVRRPVVAPRGAAVAADGGEHLGRLLAAHHRDARVRPHPEEARAVGAPAHAVRSEEHTSELQSLMRISYAVFCLKKKNTITAPT